MLEVFDLSRATDLDKQKLPIQTVNGVEPDAEGAVKIDVGVKTVNGAAPDEAGAVNIEIGAAEADIIAAADKALAAGYTAGAGQVDLAAALSAIAALEAKVARYEAELESRVYLIESGKSTDGYSWYRKYSDGWIEQGGRNYAIMASDLRIKLPKAFSTTKYSFSAIGERYTSPSSERPDDLCFTINGITTSTITVYPFDAGSNSYEAYFRWHACGY